MNKFTIILSIMLILLVIPVIGIEQTIDEECQSFGYDYGISRWTWQDDSYVEETTILGYNTLVGGDSKDATWEATPDVAGIISKEVCSYHVLPGGASGAISALSETPSIEQITFCADGESVEEDFDGEVPEFGTLTAFVILIAAGIFVARKRK